MCYALHFQYADHSNIWVTSALLAKHNHHSVYVVYIYACVRSFWLTLCISGITLLGTVEIFIAKSIFDYSLGRPAWAHLHTTLTQMSQWWDESLMVYTWILKWCGWYVAPSFILYLHTTLTKMSQWWAPHTVQIDGAVYHRIKSSHRVHLWSGFCLICLAYYIRTLHLS